MLRWQYWDFDDARGRGPALTLLLESQAAPTSGFVNCITKVVSAVKWKHDRNCWLCFLDAVSRPLGSNASESHCRLDLKKEGRGIYSCALKAFTRTRVS